MKACQMMEKDFVYVSKDDTIVDVSIKMEETKRFTLPILDDSMKLQGWATSLDITKGLREGKKIMSEKVKKDNNKNIIITKSRCNH